MRFESFGWLSSGLLIFVVLFTPSAKGQTTPTCNGLAATIVATAPGTILGTAGDDVIIGTAGDDNILGLAGNDTICGLGGNDRISGGQGVDNLFGGEGNDTFTWGPVTATIASRVPSAATPLSSTQLMSVKSWSFLPTATGCVSSVT
jgi:hypothetical protein